MLNVKNILDENKISINISKFNKLNNRKLVKTKQKKWYKNKIKKRKSINASTKNTSTKQK